MYRSASYNPFKESIYLRTWTEDGDRIDTEINFRPYLYLEKEDAEDAVSIFKTSLFKKTFKNSLERKRFVDNSSNNRIFYNLSPEQQFLIDAFKDRNGDPDFSRFPLKIFLLDIEVDTTADPGVFPTPERAAVPINLITIFDTITKTTHTWGLKESYVPTLPDCIYHRCKTEQDLILQFVDFWKSDYPDVASGWNCISENEHVWLSDKIVKIKNISNYIKNNTLKKYGQEISKYAMTGYKQEYQVTNEFGYNIKCSSDHKIMVHRKHKDEYKNFNTLTKQLHEITVQEIYDNKHYDYYMRCHLSENTNKPQTIKDIILNNFDYFYDHPLFDFYLTSKTLRDTLKEHPDFMEGIKFRDYVQGNNFWKGRSCWKFSKCKQFLTKEHIKIFIQEIDVIQYTSCKLRKEIDLNQQLSDDLLQLLGFVFTDGTYDHKRKTITYSSKYESLTEFYTSISMPFMDSKKMTIKSYNCSHNGGGFVKKLSINNIIGLMLPMIYDYNLKKHPHIEMLSQLSYYQFTAMFAGMIDGDGYVSKTSLNLCNFDCTKYGFLHDLSELLRWNGAYSRINSSDHVIGLTFDIINDCLIKRVTSLIKHPTRSKALKDAKFNTKLNSISKRLLWMYDYVNHDLIVKIRHCKQTENIVEMWDIETKDHTFLCNGMLVHNCSGFDFPYIVNRTTKLMGEDFVNQLSPVGSIRSRKVFNDNGKELTIWSFSGVNLIDYMDLYKTFSPGEKESFSLNYISELELGEGKIAYNAVSLGELAHTDWKLFVDYNIQDVHLLVKLEEKLKFLEIARLLSYKGCTNFEAALGKISIVTGAVAIQAHKQGMIIPTFPNKLERDSFEGGFVRDPEKGIQKAIVSFDVNSLYPNTIITLNISPETKLGKITQGDVEQNEDITIRLVSGAQHTISAEKFKKFLVNEKIACSKSGVLYSQKNKGILPNLIDQIYKERVEAKNELSKLKKSNKNDHQTLNKMSYYHNVQSALKVLLNSAYGVTSNKYSSMMDLDHATSITMTGQGVARAGSKILDDYARRVYGVTESVTKYGDTDSLVGDTIIQTNITETIAVRDLYEKFESNHTSFSQHGHEMIDVSNSGLSIHTFRTHDQKIVWGNVKHLVRHKVSKGKYQIVADKRSITMTEDHGCMVVRNGSLIRVAPLEINVKDDQMIVQEQQFDHKIVNITSVEHIGEFQDEYVYDIEMSDETEHTFFANDILVHNSVYISIDPILRKLNIPLVTEGQITPKVHEIVNTLDEHVNTEILEWARKDLYSTDPRFVFKREIISDVGIFLQKKRYILHVLDDEGVAADKFKYTGIELVRSTTPKKVKKFIENIIKTSLLTQDVKKTNEVYRTSYDEFQKLDPNDVAARTSINNLERYSEGASLYKYNNKTPSHVKGAIAYNILIKEHKIDDKYEAIQSAQKVKKLYCTKNKYGLTVISYVSILPKEFGIDPDWDKMFMKLVTQPTERLYQAIGWVLPEIGKEVQTDLFEMFGM